MAALWVTTCLPAGQPGKAGFRERAEQKSQVSGVHYRARVYDRGPGGQRKDRKTGRLGGASLGQGRGDINPNGEVGRCVWGR